MKKEWRGYNLLDLILISVGLITIITTGIVFNSQWYIFICTILGLLSVFTQAKGKIITQFIGIIWVCVYAFISYKQSLYGETLAYLFTMLPMYIYGAIHWLANRDKKDEVVIVRNNLSKKEWIFAGIGFVVVSVGIFFILRALNTAELIISTFAFVTMLPAVYLLIRRCKWNQVAFLVNDFIVPFLWLSIAMEGSLEIIPLCVYHIFQITYDIYGFVQWIKLEKKQKEQQFDIT